MAEKPSDKALKRLPMVQWFNPLLLAKLGLQVILSALFGRYADQRAMQAALDDADDAMLLKRADMTKAERRGGKPVLEPDDDKAVWIDYTSDLGEGFNSTYAIASLLAQESLTVDGHVLPRGGLVVMGGDEVYPTASRDAYDERLRHPYEAAFPNAKRRGAKRPRLFAIPGNHDWYDGLEAFHGIFCRARDSVPYHGGLSIGGWRCRQYRSYFALKLTEDWWLWGLDIQLTGYVDQPQVNYFRQMAGHLSGDAKVILCTAQPSWLKANDPDAVEYRSLNYITDIIRDEKGDARVCLVLAGDIHHYSRYAADELGMQFVTAGGGGAFLHPTHQLKHEMKARWSKKNTEFTLASDPGDSTKKSCYPPQDVSKQLLRGLVRFIPQNWDFCIGLGVIYGLLAILAGIGLHHQNLLGWMQGSGSGFWRAAFCDLWSGLGVTFPFLLCLAIVAIMYVYADAQSKVAKAAAGKGHALAQICVLFICASALRAFNLDQFGLVPSGTKSNLVFFAEMVLAGFVFAGAVWGAYLWFTCRFFNMHTNDGFSAMQIEGYKNFVRLRIKGDELTIYPIGLETVPGTDDWQDNPDAKDDATAPKLVPKVAMTPKLIEGPVIVNASTVKPMRMEEEEEK